jgi:hypothetical protein
MYFKPFDWSETRKSEHKAPSSEGMSVTHVSGRMFPVSASQAKQVYNL